MSIQIESVGCPLGLGEGPFWDEETQTLFYVDILKPSIHSYNTKTNEYHCVDVESKGKIVSLVVKVKSEQDRFVIAVGRSFALVHWDGVSSKPLVPEILVNVEDEGVSYSLNDGKCDPSNRLWAGTMGGVIEGTTDQFEQEKGSLYSMQKDKTIKKHLSKIGIANGLAWSLDKKRFYYIDTLKHRVDSYDYDDDSGTISNEQTIFCLKKNNIKGMPDGMTIDSEGMLWVACFSGGHVLRINPNSGELLQTLNIPSLHVTSVAFGGPNFEHLFVTTSNMHFTKELEEEYPLAGCTFRVTGLGVRGTPSLPVVL